MQIGLYLVPVNWHLARPEIEYIVEDSESKVFVETPEDLAKLKDGQPTTLPDDRWAGAVMNYTSGTTGRPKGVRRPLVDLDPDTNAELHTFLLNLFGIEAHNDGVHLVAAPLYHTAVLNFGSASMNLGHTLVLMDKWTPDGTLDRIERYRVTDDAHGADHVPPHPGPARRREEGVRPVVAAPRDPQRGALPDRREAAMLEWWGPVIYEYYAATEGGGTLVTPEQWLKKPGTVGLPWPISQVKIFDDDGNELPPGRDRHRLDEDGRLRSSSTTATRRRRRRAGQGLLHRRRRRLPRRGRLPVPVRPQDRHDHHRRREHLPGRDRGRAAHAPEGRRRWRCSASRTTTGAKR